MRFNKYHKLVLKKAIVALENELGDVFMDIMDDSNTLTAYEQLKVYAYANDPEESTTRKRTLSIKVTSRPKSYYNPPVVEAQEVKKGWLQILLEKCLVPKEEKK